ADRASSLRARLAGIAAARTQLTAQLDHELDSRRIGIGLFVGGLIALIVGQRTGLRLVDGIGGAAAVWGAIQLFSALANIKAVRGHLSRLDADRKKYEQELENL
ncbi:MAG: J domain-containing protein, partial [Coriobacteriia bacterium]|nr:J domain-containing protein [Coriobacteriia bacterium]